MPKATDAPTTPDFAPAIARFRALVADSGDRLLLGDGPPHPDAALLDLCAEALHHLRKGERAYGARKLGSYEKGRKYTDSDRAEDHRLMHVYNDGIARAKPPMALITKLRAKTAAGIYAKAMIVRASQTGAAMLAKTLAEDLIACPGLRESLWPAGDAPSMAEGMA